MLNIERDVTLFHFLCVLDEFFQPVFGKRMHEHCFYCRERSCDHVGSQKCASGYVGYVAYGSSEDFSAYAVIVVNLPYLPDELQSESISSRRPRNGDTYVAPALAARRA